MFTKVVYYINTNNFNSFKDPICLCIDNCACNLLGPICRGNHQLIEAHHKKNQCFEQAVPSVSYRKTSTTESFMYPS